jgi:hypothetical protein
MPFKGDMRLGGARRNDSTMNGFSAGPDFPAAGIIIGFQEGIERTGLYGGSQGSYYYGGNTYYSWMEIFDVNLVTDGNGGEVPDYSNYLNVRPKPSGTVVATSLDYQPSYITLPDGIQYPNGDLVGEIRHDGMGNLGYYTAPYSWSTGFITTITQPITAVESNSGSVFQVGTLYVDYSHDGNGFYTAFENAPSYYPSGNTLGSVMLPAMVNLDGYGDYQLGSHEYEVQSDGDGGVSLGGISSTSWYSYGTYITNLSDNDYFSDGYGWYYTSSTGGGGGGCPTYGTNIGGGTSDNYTYISEIDASVPNGTYTYTDYADGNCGTGWSDSTINASPSGTVLASGASLYDETNTINEISYEFSTGRYYAMQYLSNGLGSYYSEGPNVTGGYNEQGHTITSDFVAETFYSSETLETYSTGPSSASYHFQHNGTGGYQNGPLNLGSRYPSGTPVISDNTGSHAYYDNGEGFNMYLFHDGMGGYYASTI